MKELFLAPDSIILALTNVLGFLTHVLYTASAQAALFLGLL